MSCATSRSGGGVVAGLFRPVKAVNADEAMSILESRSDISLLFTDIQMPGSMDGLKLAHAVHDRWPGIKITRVLDPVPQQHRAAFKSLAALRGYRRDGGSAIGLRSRGVEHARGTLRAVHGWTQDQIELVDQSRAQKGTVGTFPVCTTAQSVSTPIVPSSYAAKGSLDLIVVRVESLRPRWEFTNLLLGSARRDTGVGVTAARQS